MTKDYAKYRVSPSSPKRRSGRPPASSSNTRYWIIGIFVTLFIGTAIGFGGAWYSQQIKPWFLTQHSKSEPKAVTGSPAFTKKNANVEVLPPPRFEFYTLLPDMEVDSKDTSEPIQTRATEKKEKEKVEVATAPAYPETQNQNIPSIETISNQVSTGTKNTTEEPAERKTLTQATDFSTTPSKAEPRSSKAPASLPIEQIKGLQFIVQAGSFRSQSSAEKLKARLAFKGLQSKIEATTSLNGEKLYRVILGPLVNQEAAQSLQTQLYDEENLNSLVLRVRV